MGGGPRNGPGVVGMTAARPPEGGTMLRVPLWRAAHGRTGDKGNRANISVIAWHPALYPLLVGQITEQAVAQRFRHRCPSRVQRFLLPRLHAMNFVLDDVLDGGVNGALNLDTHGKALAFLLLDMAVDVPRELARHLAAVQTSTGQ